MFHFWLDLISLFAVRFSTISDAVLRLASPGKVEDCLACVPESAIFVASSFSAFTAAKLIYSVPSREASMTLRSSGFQMKRKLNKSSLSVSTVTTVIVIVAIVIVAGVGGYLLYSGSTGTSSSTSSSTSTTTTSTQSVTFGLSVAVTVEYLPEYVAAHGGFWNKLGLDVTLQPFQGDGAHMQAVSSGQVSIGEASYVGEINAQSNGVGITEVGMGLQQADMILIVSNTSHYTDASQLKGATIGVTSHGSATDMMFHLLAAHYNYTIGTDIKELALGGLTAQLAALTSNQTQGFFWTYEEGYQLESLGQAKILLFMSQIIPSWAENAIYATNSLISSNPTLVKNVLQGIYNAIAYLQSNKTYAIQETIAYLGLSSTAANQTVTEAFGSGQFSTDGAFTSAVIQGMNLVRSTMLQLNVSSSLPAVNTTYSNQFVPISPQAVSPVLAILGYGNAFAVADVSKA